MKLSEVSYVESVCVGAPLIAILAVILVVILKTIYDLIKHTFFEGLRGAKPRAIVFHGNDGKESTVAVEGTMTLDIPTGVAWRRGGGRGYVSVGKGVTAFQLSTSGPFPAEEAVHAASRRVREAERDMASATDDVDRRAAKVVVDRRKRALKKATDKITVRGPAWMFIEEGADSLRVELRPGTTASAPSSSSQEDEIYVDGVDDNAKLASAWDAQGQGGPVLGGITSGRMEQRFEDTGTDIWAADDWSQYNPQYTIDRPSSESTAVQAAGGGAYNSLATFGDSPGGLSQDAVGGGGSPEQDATWACTIS